MLSLKEVRRAASVLEARLSGTRLQRVMQADDFRLILECYGHAETRLLLISCRPAFARISAPRAMPKAPPTAPAFVQYLRAHAERALVEHVDVAPNDRLVRIRLRAHAFAPDIVLSILGARSNVYLLGQEDVLVGAMRPLSETRRSLALGQPWSNPEGKPKSEGEDRWAHIPDEEYLEAIEDEYAALERREEATALARRMEAAFQKETESLARKVENMLQDLDNATKAEDAGRRGELLKSAIYRIPWGADSVTVTDYETGSEVVIPLDPRLSPAENLAFCFKQYQKALRGARALRDHLQSVKAAQEEVAGLRQRLVDLMADLPKHPEALEALAAAPRVRKLMARYRTESKAHPRRQSDVFAGARNVPGRMRPKRYRTEQGLEIWVGRSEEGNDYLTTRLARGHDLFFHLEGYPGSHVILRSGGGRSAPPAESVLCACELAVHFSKLRDCRSADVHVAPVKNVRKPKGAKPGLVYVAAGKTIRLRRDPKRLENILAARLEEEET
jgi:predicted ribosome quality control (RQC) complex YloA/Tae2 family protein